MPFTLVLKLIPRLFNPENLRKMITRSQPFGIDQFIHFNERPMSMQKLDSGQETPYLKHENFITRVIRTIYEHLDQPGFSVNDICQKLHMSNMQVYRRIKALTGRPPVQFIRQIRLMIGRSLLQSTDMNIAEIAYTVGFSDPNYFSRAFHQEFGSAPSNERQ